ncbi:hypothetical protein CR201_G0046419 [Pongo abelii]|uniref:Uncharacterized protein n=1 Tax=Pongo abelii TaxID=9601 RepID=A0A2J8XT34_PONAB|nr:hypothetical protein CR201_G0046419 [Pongo abelii]
MYPALLIPSSVFGVPETEFSQWSRPQGNRRIIQSGSPSLEGPLSGPASWHPAIGGPDPPARDPATQQVLTPSQGGPGPRGERSSPLKMLPPLNPRPRDSFQPGNLVMALIVILIFMPNF